MNELKRYSSDPKDYPSDTLHWKVGAYLFFGNIVAMGALGLLFRALGVGQ